MSRLRCTLVVLVALIIGLSFAIPVEDDPETPNDESESQPYEMTAPLSGDVVQESAPTFQAVPIVRSNLSPTARSALCRAECRELAAHHRSNSLIILDHSLRC